MKKFEILKCEHGYLVRGGSFMRAEEGELYAFTTLAEALDFIPSLFEAENEK